MPTADRLQRALRPLSYLVLGAALVFGTTLAACSSPDESGFTLPVGSVEDGQAAFTRLGCAGCHDVIGAKGLLPADQVPDMTIPLGGTRDEVYTYGALVTAIINPSHTISDAYGVATSDEAGQSRMPSFNSVMTVQELADIVTFLEAHYYLEAFPRTDYLSAQD